MQSTLNQIITKTMERGISTRTIRIFGMAEVVIEKWVDGCCAIRVTNGCGVFEYSKNFGADADPAEVEDACDLAIATLR